MPTITEDRPDTRTWLPDPATHWYGPPPLYAERPRRRPTVRGAVITLLLGAIAVGIFVLAGAVTGILDLSNPFGTTRIDRSPPVVLNQLRDLAQYHAAQGTFEATLDVEDDVGVLPSFVAGEHTIFVGIGTVDATVDFSGLPAEAMRVQGDSVTVTLPEPVLAKAVVDPKRSHVAARDRGLVNRIAGVFSDSPTSERSLYVLAAKKMDRAARASSLRERAQRNTTELITGLLTKLGYRDVHVVFVPASDLAP